MENHWWLKQAASPIYEALKHRVRYDNDELSGIVSENRGFAIDIFLNHCHMYESQLASGALEDILFGIDCHLESSSLLHAKALSCSIERFSKFSWHLLDHFPSWTRDSPGFPLDMR